MSLLNERYDCDFNKIEGIPKTFFETFYLSVVYEYDLHRPAFRCRFDRIDRVVQWKLGLNKAANRDLPLREQFQGGLKSSTSGTRNRYFIDNDSPGFPFRRALKCRFQHDRAFRPNKIKSRRKTRFRPA